MKVCAITSVYNKTHNLPIWYNYFSEQVGVENVFVVDHGSTDGSTDKLDPVTNKLILPRHKPFKGAYRFELVNNLVNDLTNYYDLVIYSGADEIIVAEP